MDHLEIIIPGRSDGDVLADGLRELTAAIEAHNGEVEEWGLGGEHGYGAEWDSALFELHRFNWEEECSEGCPFFWAEWEDSVQHHETCYQTELNRREDAAGLGWDLTTHDYKNPKLSPRERDHRRDAIYNELCTQYGLSREFGAAVHCTCDFRERFDAFHAEHSIDHNPSCRIVRPNFRHKATGLEVRWYKWIGRDMEIGHADGANIQDIISECIASVKAVD